MKSILVWVCLLLGSLTGCSTVRPLIEYQHESHFLQHVGVQPDGWDCSGRMFGCGHDSVSAGIRWRPAKGLSVDLLEGYTAESLDGYHETFTGRVSWEIGGDR